MLISARLANLSSLVVSIVGNRAQFSRAIDHAFRLSKLIQNGDETIILTEDIAKYTTDWTKNYEGGSAVALPRSCQQVSTILKYCDANNIGIVPQGGNTGLVGGQVGKDDELIVGMERLNRIIEIDEGSNIVVCEAGCTLEKLNLFAESHGLTVPLDLGSKGSCQIGGNVATNAGGMRVVKYGSLHQNIVGLEIVLASGEIIDMIRTIRKDNCGYHLKNLFIGSEGTLGMITKVAMQLVPMPRSSQVLLILLRDYSHLQSLVKLAKQHFSTSMSVVEFMDSACIESLQESHPHTLDRIPKSLLPARPTGRNIGEVLVLIELQSPHANYDDFRVEDFCSYFSDEAVCDAVVSQSQSQNQAFWAIRETVPVGLMQLSRSQIKNAGKLFKFDISLSLNGVPDLITELKDLLRARGIPLRGDAANRPQNDDKFAAIELDVCCFGHAGDQNLHLNCLLRVMNLKDIPPQTHSIVQNILNDTIYGNVLSRRGSISAEHGIGQQKREMMHQIRSPEEIRAMRQIKLALDPRNTMNPGKVIPM